MSPALANFLFEAANFLLLAAALGWMLFKPVRRALDEERQRHDAQSGELEGLRKEAEALATQAREAQRAAERELDARREAVLSAARKEASDLLEQARKKQRDERKALREELDAMRNAESLALASTVGKLAADAVRRLLEALDGPPLDMALIDAACAQLSSLPAEARRAALVESARPLDAEARRRLQGALGERFEERVVGELGAGVRVTTPAGQVDATAASIARHAGSAVAKLGSAVPAPASAEAGRV